MYKENAENKDFLNKVTPFQTPKSFLDNGGILQ